MAAEKFSQTIKGFIRGESVSFSSVVRDRRSGRRGAPEVSVSQERLSDGRHVVGVQGYTVRGARTATGETMVAIPKSVFLEAAARIVAQDIVRFTKVARDIVTFARPAMDRIRRPRKIFARI